ncbi:MAG: helix-turn-helix domain-containing protein [Rhodobacteraceae bacterium]|nr:helix-turn-helix domain-containing protein [Paracoccaceae bacterium]
MADTARPHEYVGLTRLAKLLDCSTSTVEDYTKRGILPLPVKIGTLRRWRWSDVQARIDNSNRVIPHLPPANDDAHDPILAASRGTR